MMSLSQLVRANTFMFQQNTPHMIRNMNATIKHLGEVEDAQMTVLIGELRAKIEMFHAIGAAQAYVDLMSAYADVLTRMENIIGPEA